MCCAALLCVKILFSADLVVNIIVIYEHTCQGCDVMLSKY